MRNPSLLLLCLTFVVLTAQAQEVKFGKVSKEELMEKSHPLEPDAKAAILYKEQTVRYDYQENSGWNLVTSFFVRVKIYKKEGFDWATTTIPLSVNGSDRERASSIKGITYNLSGDKIEEEKLKKEGIFEENENKFRDKVTVTMPNVKEGSVMDLQYEVSSPFVGNIDELQFQYDIPLNSMDASLKIPEYFLFKRYSKGFYPVTINESRTDRELTYREQDDASQRTNGVSPTTYNRTVKLSETNYKISVNNVPAMIGESYVNNINNYRAALKFELSGIKSANRPLQMYSKSWESVAKTIYDNSSFGSELKRSDYFKSDLNQLISTTSDPLQRAGIIYEFVKRKMVWNGYYGSTSNDGVVKAYKENAGNVAEINLILTAMLREAGLMANPVLSSTRSHGIPLFPTLEGFNYVTTCIETEGGDILLDATDKNSAPNLLPIRTLNWNGLLVRENGTFKNIGLIPQTPSKKTITVSAEIREDGTAGGKMRLHQTEYYALIFRQKFGLSDKDAYIQSLENSYGEMTISNYDANKPDDTAKPILENFEFTSEGLSENIAGKIYFSPLLFFAKNENPFKLDNREYPVDFIFPNNSKYLINIKIPEGFQVESMPESISLKLPDDLGGFTFSVTNNGGFLQLIALEDINTAIVPSMYYESLKEFYNQLVLKETEKVVLTKI